VEAWTLDLIKTIGAAILSAGGAVGLYLTFRKIDAEIKKSLREDIAELRKENRNLRGDLRRAEGHEDDEGEPE
jgi:hypothetical protein